jgi:hypothetical protein
MTLSEMLFAKFGYYKDLTGKLLNNLIGIGYTVVTGVIAVLTNTIGVDIHKISVEGNISQTGTPTPADPTAISGVGALVTSSDSDWDTPIVYGTKTFEDKKPSALGVDCYRVPICALPVNLFDSANLTDDDRTYYDDASISPITTGTRVTTMGASSAPKSRYRLFPIPKSGGTLYVSFNAATTTGKSQSSMIFYKGNYDGSIVTSLKIFTFSFGNGKSTSFAMSYDASQPYLHVMLYPANDGTTVAKDTYTDYTNFQMSLILGAAYETYHTPVITNFYFDRLVYLDDVFNNGGVFEINTAKITGVTGESAVLPGAKPGGWYYCNQSVHGTLSGQTATFAAPVTNAEVIYQLNVPVISDITPFSLQTFTGTTLIGLDTTVQPTVIDVTYEAEEE